MRNKIINIVCIVLPLYFSVLAYFGEGNRFENEPVNNLAITTFLFIVLCGMAYSFTWVFRKEKTKNMSEK